MTTAMRREPMPTPRPLIAHIIHKLDYGGLENGVVNLINRMPAEDWRHCIICMTDFTDFRKRIQRPDVEVIALSPPFAVARLTTRGGGEPRALASRQRRHRPLLQVGADPGAGQGGTD